MPPRTPAKVGASTGYGPGDQDEIDKLEAIAGASGTTSTSTSGGGPGWLDWVTNPAGAATEGVANIVRPYLKVGAGALGLLVIGVALVYAAGRNTPVGGALEGAAGGAAGGPAGVGVGAVTGAASRAGTAVRERREGRRWDDMERIQRGDDLNDEQLAEIEAGPKTSIEGTPRRRKGQGR